MSPLHQVTPGYAYPPVASAAWSLSRPGSPSYRVTAGYLYTRARKRTNVTRVGEVTWRNPVTAAPDKATRTACRDVPKPCVRACASLDKEQRT